MSKKTYKKKKSFWKRVRFNYKLLFLNESTLEEVWSFRISQLSGFLTVLLFAFFLIFITSVIIIRTPIRNYLPGYLDQEVRNEIVRNALRADSLGAALQIHSLYLKNVSDILTGNVAPDSIPFPDSVDLVTADYNIRRSEKEDGFVKSFEEEEKYSLTGLISEPVATEGLFFYKPINGIISSHYDKSKNHKGVDLVAAPKESVLATLEGTVIYTGYDIGYGNVIVLQHKNGFISIYKHNEILLKEMGVHVTAGEAIAIVGNTGELSTGPHLHFELWYKGESINPEDCIAF
ncbi:MAG: M23 family metallopeptidase [Tannerella sp.]|jgi:lipoprotein NlpD|nr:M23 family metallopeptidase [Tannerella sp.]